MTQAAADESKASVTRRTVLAGAVAGGAAVAASSVLGAGAATAAPATAADTAAATTQQQLAKANIKHVVFLMMENRSFDHLFGTLSSVRGFDDRTVTRPDGGNIFAQFDPKTKTYELPYPLTQINDLPDGDADLSHNWGPQHMSLNGGTNDNWIGAHRASDGDAYGPYTMGYLTRADAPYHYALADAFTVCDNYFCSVLGPTYPNRLMWEMGSIDANAVGGGPLLTTDEGVFTGNGGLGVFSYETFPERLTKAGVSWTAYTEAASNHLLNMFPAFTQYNLPAGSPTNVVNGTAGLSTGAFLADVAAGTLPVVSWIFPTPQSTEHPGDGPINAGPEFYEPIITALMASESWADTALFITYDENDGYFDHVPPPTAPAGTPGEFLLGPAFGHGASSTDPTTGKTVYADDPSMGIEGPVGLGFRVPNLVISPWSTGGRMNSELFDHTSCLKLVEVLTGVSPKGIVSDWRYNLVGDLTSCFDFTTATPVGTPPAALQTAFVASQALLTAEPANETPPANGTMPVQETTPVRTRVGPVPHFATSTATSGTTGAAATTTVTSKTSTSGKTTAKKKATAKKKVAHTSAGAGKTASVTEPTGTLAYTGGLPTAGVAAGLAAAGVAAVAVARSRSGSDDDGPARPAIVLADGVAQATSTVSRRRITTGGASDSTRAGGHLPRPVRPEPVEVNDPES